MKIHSQLIKFMAIGLMAVHFAGCSDDDSDDKPVESGRGADGSINYRIDLASQMAGTYSGDCVKFPEGTVTTTPVVFSASGDVSTDGASGSLLSSDVSLVHTRKFNGADVESFAFNGTDVSSTKGLNAGIESGTTDESNLAGARLGIGNSPGVRCTKVPNAAALKAKSPYAVVSRYLTSEKRTLKCLINGTVQVLDYEVGSDAAKIGDEVFPLTTLLTEESAVVLPRENFLNYAIKTNDNRALTISIDEKASLKVVSVKDKNGDEYGCVP